MDNAWWLDTFVVEPASDASERGAAEEVVDHSPDDGRLSGMRPQSAVLDDVPIGPLLVPHSVAPVMEVPLPHAPGGVVRFSTGLLGEDGNDRPHTGLGGVQAVGDEHDPAAHLLEFVEDQADVSHTPPAEPVELGDVERLDPAREKSREGVVEAAARAVLPCGDIELLELELRRDVLAVAFGGLMAQPTLVVGGERIVGGGHRR
jgi:hypothetical protein